MTTHKYLNMNSSNMELIDEKSVDLIITSPPYPMIEMWDEIFSQQNPEIANDLKKGDGNGAFYRMHEILNCVWDECDRVLKDNGFICINVGDATRTINGNFQLYSNHTRIIDFFLNKGYSVLPDIHWRKQSNSPNKFMGSGMYPAGAYVTYEHEYILIFRKGGKRQFYGNEKKKRQKSAFFWEERNIWFSDLWEIKGVSQTLFNSKSTRSRNASFPFEVPYRLINMYSVEEDIILDPFAGLGTTNIACMVLNRNSIGIDIDRDIMNLAMENKSINVGSFNKIISDRIKNHLSFVDALPDDKKAKCYKNEVHGFLVKTRQEVAMEIKQLASITQSESGFECSYKLFDQLSFSE